jgi:hypothetical protein
MDAGMFLRNLSRTSKMLESFLKNIRASSLCLNVLPQTGHRRAPAAPEPFLSGVFEAERQNDLLSDDPHRFQVECAIYFTK